jgi:hypothetical protein
LALSEHAFSVDFATESQHWRGMRQRGAWAARRRRCKSRAQETLKKKRFCNGRSRKKRLPKSAHVLFSAPILIARLQPRRVSQS